MKTNKVIILFTFLGLLLAPFCKSDNSSRLKRSNQIYGFVANRKELSWLKENCIKIKTVQAENGFKDLQPLKKMIGNARIVGLGENTHGTSEIFKMKHRLVEFLYKEMGFTVFSIEANMPEAYKLNDYVQNGIGNSKNLLKGMYFWTWNTQEVLDMIEWMRKINETEKTKIQFTGFDMQICVGPLETLSSFSKYDQIFKTKVDSISVLFNKLLPLGSQPVKNEKETRLTKDKCNQLLVYLNKNKSKLSNYKGEIYYKWLIQNVNILLQCIVLNEETSMGDSYRDECMAKNIQWILDNNPNAKIVLWAHNEHISNQEGSMGRFLSEKYGDNYYNIGFLSNSGMYTAIKEGKLSSQNKLIESKPGSIEYSFHKTKIPCFFFDFIQTNSQKPENKWLTSTLYYRRIGALATDNQFSSAKINSLFKAVIYIDETKPSQSFGSWTKN
jgi:erythromycin esterase